MDGKALYFIVPLVVFALVMFALLGGRKLVFSYISELYRSKRYDELIDFLDTLFVKLLYPQYNRTYTRLNAYLAKGDADKAARAFDELLTMKTSSEQRKDLVVKAFEFYMNTGRHKDAKALLEEIATFGSESLTERCELTYDIVARKSSRHIDEMEAELAGDVSHARRLELSYLLALQYRNRGDEESADRWQAEAEGLLGMPLS